MKRILRPILSAAFGAALLTGAARADDAAGPAPAKKWKDSAEASFVSTNGNSKTSTTAGKDLFSYDFTATSKSSQDVEYLQSLADRRDTRINAETALTTSLNAHFSVKTSFTWKRNNQPPPGFSKDDELTSFALIADF